MKKNFQNERRKVAFMTYYALWV